MNRFIFGIPKKLKTLKEHRRQGRSYESREKNPSIRVPLQFDLNPQSPCSCVNPLVVSDNHEGTFVCTSCGAVSDDRFIAISYSDNYGKKPKKDTSVGPSISPRPYFSYNYGMEKIAQLSNRDPRIWKLEWRKIEKKCQELSDEEFTRLGPRTVSRLCKELGLSHRKYGERWIQVRVMLGLEYDPLDYRADFSCSEACFRKSVEIGNWYSMPYWLVVNLKQRLILIDECHQKYFSDKSLFNLNYILLQCIRLELDGLFEHWNSYIKVTKSENKLRDYNSKWKLWTDHLKSEYCVYDEDHRNHTFISPTRTSINWDYYDLKASDLLCIDTFD